MKKDITRKLELALSIFSSGFIPVTILGVSFVINYITNLLELSNDLPSNIIIYIGGISSVVFYSYLVFSDIRLFMKEEDGDYQLKSIEIDKAVKKSKEDFDNIIASNKEVDNSKLTGDIFRNFSKIEAQGLDTDCVVRTIVNSSKQIALAIKMDMKGIDVLENVLSDVIVSARDDVSRFSQYYKIEKISGHRIAAIYTHWISKLKPFHTDSDASYFNEMVAIKVGLTIMGKSEESFNDSHFYKNLIYHLRYRNTGSDCLSLLFQMLEGEEDEKN